jgi:hypothetical protein
VVHLAGILVGGSNHAQLLLFGMSPRAIRATLAGRMLARSRSLPTCLLGCASESHSSVPPSATRFLLRAIVPPGSAARRAIFCANDCRTPRSSGDQPEKPSAARAWLQAPCATVLSSAICCSKVSQPHEGASCLPMVAAAGLARFCRGSTPPMQIIAGNSSRTVLFYQYVFMQMCHCQRLSRQMP